MLERIIDIVKFIGKRGLSFRGVGQEAAYTLDDSNSDHGYFLELLILLGNYDTSLKEHLTHCIKESKKHHKPGAIRQGRGSLITFLSNKTVNNVLDSIQLIICNSISKEIRDAGMFSVQIDTTMDISCEDQCSVIRYVTDVVHERLLAVVNCEASTGE